VDEVIIRVADDPRRAEGWSFTLEALGIAHRVLDTNMGAAIVVDSAVASKAAAALTESDREAAELAPPEPAAPDSGPSSVGVVMAMALVAFFFVTGSRGETSWFAAGSAVAELVVRGQWWRAVTALTLHSNLGHVAGNAAALIIFVSALGRWLGPGLAAFLVLFTGAAGNLLNAYAHGAGHDSVGASTAAFGAVGLLGGLQFMRRLRFKKRLDRRRRALLAVAACLGIFAALGSGGVEVAGALPTLPKNIDVMAHLFGLGMGLVTGLVVGRFLRRPAGWPIQVALVLGTAGAIAACWWRALG
jgi:rhomboid protease GluP